LSTGGHGAVLLIANCKPLKCGSARMGIPSANAVTFSDAPAGAALAFDAVGCVAAPYRAGDADYVQHLSKAAKNKKD
jgi:hypothetical protein